MKVSQLMQRRVHTLKPADTMSIAAQLLAWSGVRHLPVIEGDRLVGLVSERDLMEHRDLARQTEVREIMTTPVRTVRSDESAYVAGKRLIDERIGCLPVVDDGELVGILTKSDLVLHEVSIELGGMTGGDSAWSVMTPDPQTARLDDYLLDAVGRMTNAGVRHLPVVDSEGRVLGMLSDRDVRQSLGELSSAFDEGEVRTRVSLRRVGDVCTRGVVTVTEDAPLGRLVALLGDFRVGAIPVVDPEQKLVGIVSYLDVLHRLAGAKRSASAPGYEAGAEERV